MEASLETHRKSNSDLQARFDLVLGTLRDITSGIGTTLGVVEPPKEPEPPADPTLMDAPSQTADAGTDDTAGSTTLVRSACQRTLRVAILTSRRYP